MCWQYACYLACRDSGTETARKQCRPLFRPTSGCRLGHIVYNLAGSHYKSSDRDRGSIWWSLDVHSLC
ncbi:hypothetical protein CY34DRAFT_735889 [Suillus luteus UH-Slu-Lm8-n1]|uniref:Uncharacterized protein n=1 Tax=Suillus luteus UH-Slu-Lm8-n1 TaxID=930992 RepID=A0A0C9ZZP2_9AGAM|nr:hypothetical protein CY34DRAFT_735889 [Suillus luteus UH-Slu-Lm8-n1]